MDEWADKIRKITIEKWLKANPGKTEKDYEEYLREDEKRTRERKRREELQQEAEVKLGCLGLLFLGFIYIVLPMVCAFAVGFIIPAAQFWPSAFGFFILILVARFLSGLGK